MQNRLICLLLGRISKIVSRELVCSLPPRETLKAMFKVSGLRKYGLPDKGKNYTVWGIFFSFLNTGREYAQPKK